MPEGFDPEQFKNGSMPERFTKPENMPEGFDPEQFGGGRGGAKGTTGEEKTVRIPVGTKVTTALGVETDFEVLKAGDVIKCSIENNDDGEEISSRWKRRRPTL